MFFITIVIGVFILCLGCVVSVSLCLCRRERLLQRQQQRIALQQQYTSHQLLDTTHTGATPILQHNNSYNSKLDGCKWQFHRLSTFIRLSLNFKYKNLTAKLFAGLKVVLNVSPLCPLSKLICLPSKWCFFWCQLGQALLSKPLMMSALRFKKWSS